jgi:dipeptidase
VRIEQNMTKLTVSWKGLSACLLFGATILLSNRQYQAKACTVFVVGKDASADGSVMCSHSNDGEFDTDPRLVKVPAGQYSPGDRRPIFFSPENYPRYVGRHRGIPEYYPKEGEPQHESFVPIGYIPQVSNTYAYLEETYGAVNEMQVGIGESTCSGIFGARPIHQHPNGTALFSIDELSRIAMERASTARKAVVLMGELAEAHGFYGAGEFEGTAESLAVTDPREAWIFHILPDPTAKSAIWAAERVDDDKFAVIANMFVIRNVDPEDTDRFLMSDSVHKVATDYGWWTSVEKDGFLDFTKIYSDGEYAHKYYSGRRMWASYRLAAPSLKLPSDYTDLQSDPVYPLAAIPDKPLSERDLFRFHRDTLRGTQFDLSAERNLAGGAFGTPDRWKAGPNEATKVEGNWERAIGLYRTSDTYVVQSKEQEQHHHHQQQLSEQQGGAFPASPGAILWFGPSSPLATIFTPFVVSMSDIPVSFRSGHQSVFSRDSAFWAACYAHNIANLKWSYMIQDITKRQDDLEKASLELVASIEKDYYHTTNHQNHLELVEEALAKNADSIVKSLWSLSDELIFRYADGFLNFPESEIDQHRGETTQVLGYPSWWLEAVGYRDGPPPPPTQPKCCDPPKTPRNIGMREIKTKSKEPNATKPPPSSLLRGQDRAETAMGIE